jgi:hypothetical protein
MPKKRKSSPDRENQIVLNPAMALQKIRNEAVEYFDHGIILVSHENGGKTEFCQTTFGNEFALKGMIEVFLNEYVNEQVGYLDDEDEEDN